MRIALLKPDWRVRGGGELAVDLVEGLLRQAGHAVDRHSLDIPGLRERGRAAGLSISADRWAEAPEYFDFAAALTAWRAVDLTGYDAVVSTQPCSYAVEHERHLSVFLHHQRHFYDLADAWVAAGFADPSTHALAAAAVQAVDAEVFPGVRHFLPISRTVADRLARYNGRSAGVSLIDFPPFTPWPDLTGATFDHALVVGRHEFPKRTEWAIAALELARPVPGLIVGGGGRLEASRRLAALMASGALDPAAESTADLWLHPDPARGVSPGSARNPPVPVLGRVSDEDLAAAYRAALCVIAPAYNEDYGLTALEAMQHAKPVIVCSDGGGLVDLVDHGVTGLVVEPLPSAIAEAVRALHADPAWARSLGAAGREAVAAFTLERTRRQLLRPLREMMDA